MPDVRFSWTIAFEAEAEVMLKSKSQLYSAVVVE